MRNTQNFSGSNTHIFSMIYPWLVILSVMLLHEVGVIDVLKIKNSIVLGAAIIPVIVSVIWFLIKNKGLHKRLS